MALQAGVSTVKVIVLLGAGLTGTFLVNNGRLTDFISDVSKVFAKHMSEGEVAGKVSDKTAELTGQLLRMRQELMQLASNRDITVINGSAGGTGAGSLLLPAVVVGSAGYGYIWWRGWKLSDFMYVTKRHMSNAITEVSKQFDNVSSALAATRKHLSLRIDGVSKALEESAEVQGVIRDQVLEIKNDVSRCGDEVQTVQHMVAGLGTKMIEVSEKQEFTNEGIRRLCHFVQNLESGQANLLETKAATLQLLHMHKPQLPAPASSSLASSSSTTSSPSSEPPANGGLKELQNIFEKLGSMSGGAGSSNSITRASRTFSFDVSKVQNSCSSTRFNMP